MKRNHTLIAGFAFALLLIGCNKDDDSTIANVGNFDENEIGFLSSTTRADYNTLSTIQGDTDGFGVYATYGLTPNTFEFSNEQYSYNGNGWVWKNSQKWPTDATDYPVQFYAYYPKDLSFYTVAATSPTISITSNVTIPAATADVNTQADLLSANSKTDVRPVDGKIDLTFEHILSCVDLVLTIGDNANVHLQSVNFEGMSNNAIFDHQGATWSSLSTTNDAGYTYLKTTKPATSLTTATATFTPTNSQLMLMPQQLTKWDTTGVLDDARVEIIFRAQDINLNKDQIGYSRADMHPDFPDDETQTVTSPSSPLFIRVAFPLDTNWEMGKHYTYEAELGGYETNNGQLADKYYYDEDGKKTEFEVDDLEIGDDVTSSEIKFDVDVTNWVKVTPNTPLQ